jgi:hypothetical protein
LWEKYEKGKRKRGEILKKKVERRNKEGKKGKKKRKGEEKG